MRMPGHGRGAVKQKCCFTSRVPADRRGTCRGRLGQVGRNAAGGEVSAVAARHVDILPTVLDAIGQPIPADLPGRTLLPAAERRGAAVRTSYFEAMGAMLNRGWAPLTGVLADRDKLIDVPIRAIRLAADRGNASTSPAALPIAIERSTAALAGSARAARTTAHGRSRRGGPAARARVVGGSAPPKRATPTRTMPSASSASIARCTTPSRRSAHGASTRRCGSMKG